MVPDRIAMHCSSVAEGPETQLGFDGRFVAAGPESNIRVSRRTKRSFEALVPPIRCSPEQNLFMVNTNHAVREFYCSLVQQDHCPLGQDDSNLMLAGDGEFFDHSHEVGRRTPLHLCMMWARWNLIVRSVVASSPPTCLLSIPEAMRGMTSRSRGVSCHSARAIHEFQIALCGLSDPAPWRHGQRPADCGHGKAW